MRRVIKSIITDVSLGDYSTIEDETSIEEVRKALGKPARALCSFPCGDTREENRKD